MAANTTPIPAALRKLLDHAWMRNEKYSPFLSNYEDRRREPSFYIYQKQRPNDGQVFTIAELEALANDGVLDGLVTDYENTVAVNEHAEHAISDFCSTVYRAWDELEARLDAVRRRAPLD